MKTLLYALVFVTSAVLTSAQRGLDTVYEWRYIDYMWESEARRQQAINAGEYNISQVLPMDVNRAADGRVFMSLLGTVGTPATLVTVTDQMGPNGPLVLPYPDWSHFRRGDCNSIQNVYRIALDECQRLWVLDTGYLEEQTVTCEPQLLAFDLRTDRLIQRIKIPFNVARGSNNESLLATPIIETSGGGQCEETTVYMSDPMGRGLVIWNGVRLFRLENPVFNPSDDATNITSGGQTLRLAGGIVTMDISPRIFPGEERFLYFHALASRDVYAASTNVLKRSTDGSTIRFLGARNILSSQAVGVAFSAESTFFMGLTRESAIACWNRYRQLDSLNIQIVVEDENRLQYANGMKIIREPYSGEEELWTLSNRFISFQRGLLNYNDINFRILKGSVKNLIAGTVCEMPPETRRALDEISSGDKLIFEN